jgi:hypothetical protein
LDGAGAVSLMTTFLMPVARAMYEAMGFQLVAEYDDWSEGKYFKYVLHLVADG